MFPAFQSKAGQRGVSLVEFLIYMLLVVVILAGSAQLLFIMRQSATRMELEADARQTARQADDYIARYVRGATDMNRRGGNPFAIVVWYQKGTTLQQASYNNVTDSTLADLGTDIITLAYPTNRRSVKCDTWPGYYHGANAWWFFDEGCPNDATNLQLFKEITGAHQTRNGEVSEPVVVIDKTGAEVWYEITHYLKSDCATGRIHVTANPGLSNQLNPPGGQPNLTDPVTMMPGPRFVSFRVFKGWLQQKQGIFDATVDNDPTTTSFQNILPDVEDLQIAWIFADGTVWDNDPAHRLTSTGAVPTQNAAATYDVANVVGLRVTVTARSDGTLYWEHQARFFRPAAEDHTASTVKDKRYHRRMTEAVMIRNRNLGD